MKQFTTKFSLLFLLLSISSCFNSISKPSQKSNLLTLYEKQPTEEINKSNFFQLYRPSSLKKKKNFWNNLLTNWKIKYNKNNPIYLQHYRWFKQHPEYLYKVLINAQPFLGYIKKLITKNQMPNELILLPFIESNYDPYAYSYQGAAGIWQLMNLTAKRFHVQQNWWYDGRRDIHDSTTAALKYLKFLHKEFNNNWLLAIAAYNAGEGTVQRAILKNKKNNISTDFWHLKLPQQTIQYVPKWLALCNYVKNILEKNPEDLPKITDNLKILNLSSQIDLRIVSQLSQLPLEKIYFYNPGFNQWATAPDIKQQLLLPHKNFNFFKESIKNIPKDKLVTWTIYTIVDGDNLGKISEKFNITLHEILRYNKIKKNKIYPNQHLILPIASVNNKVYEYNMLNARKSLEKTIEIIKHTVKKGDSLWKIAHKYRVTINKLCKWNQINAKYPIKPNDTINIIKKIAKLNHQSIRPEVIRKVLYRVKKGESCSLIAKKFKLPIKKMYEWNSVCNKNIYPKQKLKIFIDVTKQTT